MKIQQDKIKHFAACFAVALAASATEAAMGAPVLHSAAAGSMASMAIGVGKEYGDRCAPGNRWDWADIAADTLGSVFGAAAGASVALIKAFH